MTNFKSAILDLLLGIKPNDILNSSKIETSKMAPAKLAEELASTIKLVRTEVYDPDAKALDYENLAQSLLYASYRKNLAPALQHINLEAISDLNQQKAFWINLYNALVIDAVIQYKVSASVTEGFLGILRFFRKAAYNIGGHRFSLEDIEHGILRSNRGNPYIPGSHFGKNDPRLKFALPRLDPRIHFAINCASVSCPPINTYNAENLDFQLELASRNFIDQEVSLRPDHLALCLSTIFKWFGPDFGGSDGLAGFLCKYLPEGKRLEWLKHQSSPMFEFAPYNWALNSPDF